jgi:hypothetical protein
MTIFGWARWVSIGLHDEILTKYYSREEIANNNLTIESTRNEIRVSNGDILPNDEYLIFHSKMWKRTIPCILMWILFFVFLLFVFQINWAANKFFDDKKIISQHNIVNGHNLNYNEAVMCILNKIDMSFNQDVYNRNRLIIELIGNINKTILECNSESTLLDSMSAEEWYQAITPKSLKQSKTAVD